MEGFTYCQPTEIRFGRGRIRELGEAGRVFGKRCLLVTGPASEATRRRTEAAMSSLRDAGLDVAHFEGVVPNPTTESITAGAKAARQHGTELVIGLGGGSAMDSAKAIAVEASHEGTAWDYLFFKKAPTEKTLPVIAVSTTSGTGSQVTQVAVLTHTATKTKSAIYHARVFPRVCIVDPDLMVTVPHHVTASTGFDAFAHAFEAFIHVGGNAYADLLAVEAMRLIRTVLPRALANGADVDARERMAWADTLAGLCIATAGVTLPHGIGMTISGFCPHVMHGESLAVTYPEFTRYTWASSVAKFAAMGRILDPALENADLQDAAERSCSAMDAFLKQIDMWTSFEKLNVSRQQIEAIADNCQVLPDYKNNPRVATLEEIHAMLNASWRR
jgi:alcohol dehydrogenase